jgi:DNA-binding response OmpR family regulator
MDTILLVYAHDFLRRYLAEILETRGYRAVQAGHTTAALQCLSVEVRLILCEEPVANVMVAEGDKWGIPVIVTTSNLSDDELMTADRGDNFLEIPFSIEELLNRVAATLRHG